MPNVPAKRERRGGRHNKDGTIAHVYTPELGAEICERMAKGESLNSICETPGYPAPHAVRMWYVNGVEDFVFQYTRAVKARALYWSEEILEIADNGSNDWMERNDPENPGYVVNGECIARSRIRVDTRKWLLSKVLPKVFGDKLLVEEEKPVEQQRVLNIDNLTPDEREELKRLLLKTR